MHVILLDHKCIVMFEFHSVAVGEGEGGGQRQWNFSFLMAVRKE